MVKIRAYDRFDGELYITRKENMEYDFASTMTAASRSRRDNSEQSAVGAKPSLVPDVPTSKSRPVEERTCLPVADDRGCDQLKRSTLAVSRTRLCSRNSYGVFWF